MKHIFKLTKEEKAIEAAVKRSEARVISAAEQTRLRKIARNTTAKNKTITIRLTERNLIQLKAAAAKEGVPYQTFLTSLIHKNV